METTTAKKVNVNHPPFVMMTHQRKLLLMEEIEPLLSKEECKNKIKELNDGCNIYNLRSKKYKGRYFIYRLKHV